MPIYPAGFLPYGSDDDSIVLQCTLRDSSNINGGTEFGTPTYDSDLGVLLGADGKIRWQNIPGYSDLENGGHITFWVSGDFLSIDHQPAASEVLFSTGGSQLSLSKTTTAGRLLPRGGSQNCAITPEISQKGKGDKTRVDISYDGSKHVVYIEYLPSVDEITKHYATNDFFTMVLGDTITTNSPASHYISDLQISTRPIMVPGHPSLVINTYGDSIMMQGQYPSDNLAITSIIPDGLSGANYDATSTHDDAGMVATIHRELSKLGLNVNRINTWHEGGSGIETSSPMSTRRAISLNGSYLMPNIAIVYIGTNDVGSGQTIDSTWKATYQVEIDALLAVGCDKIIIVNVAPRSNAPAEDTPTDEALTLAANEQIAALAVDNTEVTEVDIFTKLGGFNGYDPNDYQTGDYHLGTQGQQKVGKWIGDSLLSILS